MKNNTQTSSGNSQDFEWEKSVQATAWFSSLMHARVKSNFKEAAQALHELEQLGIVVKFRRPGRKS